MSEEAQFIDGLFTKYLVAVLKWVHVLCMLRAVAQARRVRVPDSANTIVIPTCTSSMVAMVNEQRELLVEGMSLS